MLTCAIKSVLPKEKSVRYGAPQVSILGPILFLLFMNDLPFTVTKSVTTLFADNATLTISSKIKDLEKNITMDRHQVFKSCNDNKLVLNFGKTSSTIITTLKELLSCIGKPETCSRW